MTFQNKRLIEGEFVEGTTGMFRHATSVFDEHNPADQEVGISEARSLSDFRAAMPLMRAGCLESDTLQMRIDIGKMASTLSNGGSGPETGCLLQARSGSEILGCLVVWVISAEQVEFKSLYVLPSYRNRGIELKLLREALKVSQSWGLSVAD